MSDKNFEPRSDEIQEILGLIPHWIVRWGITLIFLALVMVLIATWVIQYPEIIPARIILLTQQPPIGLIARSGGKVFFAVKENEYVKANTYLAAIENPASVDDVFALKARLEELDDFLRNPEPLKDFRWDKSAKLGELQAD